MVWECWYELQRYQFFSLKSQSIENSSNEESRWSCGFKAEFYPDNPDLTPQRGRNHKKNCPPKKCAFNNQRLARRTIKIERRRNEIIIFLHVAPC